MAKYFITYDLKDVNNAAQFEAALGAIGAKKVLESVWHVDLQIGKSQQVKDSLSKYTARDERLLVIEASDFSVK